MLHQKALAINYNNTFEKQAKMEFIKMMWFP